MASRAIVWGCWCHWGDAVTPVLSIATVVALASQELSTAYTCSRGANQRPIAGASSPSASSDQATGRHRVLTSLRISTPIASSTSSRTQW